MKGGMERVSDKRGKLKKCVAGRSSVSTLVIVIKREIKKIYM